ncbi:MAG: DinB family protein [Chloroflexi bacterium]|nr:DinB family protein [Chloroflexota bacterium]
MKAGEIRDLYEYNYWANGKVLDAAARVKNEEFIAPAGMNYMSLRGTLAHILGAEWVWRTRCQEGKSPAALPRQEDFKDLATLRSRWKYEEGAMRSYVGGLTDADLERLVTYRSTEGVEYRAVLWKILAHVVNHGTQHRSEAAVRLTELGASPGDLDFIMLARTKAT